METSGSADLFGRTVSVHAGGLVMSSSRSSMPWSKTPSQRSSSVAALSLDADERPAMTTAKDAYPFEFVWIGPRQTRDAGGQNTRERRRAACSPIADERSGSHLGSGSALCDRVFREDLLDPFERLVRGGLRRSRKAILMRSCSSYSNPALRRPSTRWSADAASLNSRRTRRSQPARSI